MSFHSDRYYRDSGNVPIRGLLLMVSVGAGIAVVGAFVYALINYYVPSEVGLFHVLIGIVAPGFGYFIGIAVDDIARSEAVRSRITVRIIALVCGLIGAYFAWVWFVWILAKWDTDFIILNPGDLSRLIVRLGETGVWEWNGESINGARAYAMWSAEAIAIVGLALAANVRARPPYCEHCRCWTRIPDVSLLLNSDDPDSLRRDLEAERYGTLDKLCVLDRNPVDYLYLKIYACPQCQESNYITVVRITKTTEKNRMVVKEAKFIVCLAVPEQVVRQVERLGVAQSNERSGPETADDPEADPSQSSEI